MPVTIHDMLQPQVVLDLVSRVRKGQGRLGRWLGFHVNSLDEGRGTLSGPNTKESPTRSGTYRLFDRTRTVAMGRAPGTGPAVWSPQPVGEVNYTCARFHEKIRLDYEELSQLSPIIGPNSQLDPGGQSYIVEQTKFMAARFNNVIEMLAMAMIRGHLYLHSVGENWIPKLSAPAVPYVDVDFRIPAGNLSQLNMLGAGSIIDVSWANPAAKIVSQHLPKISQAFAQLHGYPLADIWVDPLTWGYVTLNTEVINSAGSANQPFSEWEYVRERGDDGKQVIEQVATLRGYPNVRWHILPDVLVADGGTDPSYSAGTGTLTQVIPANSALFMPEVDSEWVDLIHCSEYVSDNPGQPAVRRPGFYFWHEFITQPTALEMIGLLNAIPRLRIPKALALGTVIF